MTKTDIRKMPTDTAPPGVNDGHHVPLGAFGMNPIPPASPALGVGPFQGAETSTPGQFFATAATQSFHVASGQLPPLSAKFPRGGVEMGQGYGLLGARQTPSSLPPMMDARDDAYFKFLVSSPRVQELLKLAQARVSRGYVTLLVPNAAILAERSQAPAPDQGLEALPQSAAEKQNQTTTAEDDETQSSPQLDDSLDSPQVIAEICQFMVEATHEISEYGWLLGVDMAGDVAQWRAYAQGAVPVPQHSTMWKVGRRVANVVFAMAKKALGHITNTLAVEKERAQRQMQLKRRAEEDLQARSMRQRIDTPDMGGVAALHTQALAHQPAQPPPFALGTQPMAPRPTPEAVVIGLTGGLPETTLQGPHATPQQRLIQCARQALTYRKLLPGLNVEGSIHTMLEYASGAVGQVDEEDMEAAATQAEECCAQLAAMLSQARARPTPYGYPPMAYHVLLNQQPLGMPQ